MKVVLTFVIMIPLLLFSILSYYYTAKILEYRNIKNTEINEAFNLISEVEEILALPIEDFFNNIQISETISTTTKEATVYIFNHDGYDFVYIEK